MTGKVSAGRAKSHGSLPPGIGRESTFNEF